MATKSPQPQPSQNKGSGFQSLSSESKAKKSAEPTKKPPAKAATNKTPRSPKQPKSKPSSGIPEVVSRRMAKRMLIFCGVPTLLGLSTFPVSYFFLFQNGIELPNVAVLFASLGLFGLGVAGLSYGVVSASWDEDKPGSLLGFQEFSINFGRIIESWKEARDRDRSSQ